MRSLAPLLIAAALAGPARAEPVAFSYAFEAVFPNHPGSPTAEGLIGSVTFAAAPPGSAVPGGPYGLAYVPAATFTFVPHPLTDEPVAYPAVSIDEPTVLKMTLTDSASGESAVATFRGVLSEAEPFGAYSLYSAFGTTWYAPVPLGGHIYNASVRMERAEVPSSGSPLLVTATGFVSETPEPGTLALAATAASAFLARRRWRRGEAG